MNQENIEFEIVFESKFWDKPPGATVRVDEHTVFDNLLLEPRVTLKFLHTLAFDQTHMISIYRWNKTDDQCQIDQQQHKDQMLILQQLKIDGVDMQNVIHTRSWFEPQYSHTYRPDSELEQQVIGETWFGHNGVWRLEFRSPVWQWIIQDIWNG